MLGIAPEYRLNGEDCMDRSNGPNFYYHARAVSVRIGKDTRNVRGLFELITGSFSETGDERSRVQTATVALRASDFPDGVPDGAVVTFEGNDWFVTAPSAGRDGLVHLMLRRALPQRTGGKFSR